MSSWIVCLVIHSGSFSFRLDLIQYSLLWINILIAMQNP